MGKTNPFIITYFFIKPTRKNKTGFCPIFCRLSQNGKRIEFTIKQTVNPALWDQKRQRTKGNSEAARTLNYYLDSMSAKIANIYSGLLSEGFVSLERVYEKLTDKPTKFTLLTAFDVIYEEKQKLLNIEIGLPRLKKYGAAKKKIEAFLKEGYNKKDLNLYDLTPEFITRFETYLLTNNCQRNTANNYLKILKTCTRRAFQNGWVTHNPFEFHKCKFQKIKRGYLTEEEINRIINAPIEDSQLDLTRDIFLVSVFTGMAYSDVYQLKKENFEKGNNGKEWIIIHRKKTGERSTILLLDIPKAILKKYENHPLTAKNGNLLPVLSNQRCNIHLKLIAKYAKVDKRLSTHIARHTYATTVALLNGLSMEVISNNLGHASTRTTAIYGEVVQEKIGNEMQVLKEKVAGTYTYPAALHPVA